MFMTYNISLRFWNRINFCKYFDKLYIRKRHVLATLNEEQREKVKVIAGPYKACVLQKQEDIIAAQTLLHDVYVDEQHWKWNVDNPTGFRIKQSEERKYIVDNYESNSIWIGTFCREEIISCLRVVYRTEGKKLDVEGYVTSLHPDVARILNFNNLVEVQRLAIKRTYRGQGINFITLTALFKLLIETDMSIIWTQKGHSSMHQFGTILDDKLDYGDGIYTNVMLHSMKEIEKLLQFSVKRSQYLC